MSALEGAAGELLAALEALRLVDHHVHGAWTSTPTPAAFATALVEADTEPVPDSPGDAAALRALDSQLGFAVRRWCAPLLGLEPRAPAADHLARRTELGEAEVAARLLPTAGVGTWLVDTGHASAAVQTPAALAAASQGTAHEVVRLEALAEELVATGPHDYPARLRALLAQRVAGPPGAPRVVATKSVLAYRAGFDVDLARPSDAAVQRAAQAWAQHEEDREQAGAGGSPRLVDPLLLVFGIHVALDAGLPLQLHVGFGDRDLDLHRTDPLLLLPLLRADHTRRVPVMLLHCYPYERQAGYLAQAFGNVHVDVGLAVNYLGARSTAVIARSLEMAPFHQLLFSSDAWGPAELHHLGALLWRRGTAVVLGRFVADGDWSMADARRIAEQIGAGNATRAYQL